MEVMDNISYKNITDDYCYLIRKKATMLEGQDAREPQAIVPHPPWCRDFLEHQQGQVIQQRNHPKFHDSFIQHVY